MKPDSCVWVDNRSIFPSIPETKSTHDLTDALRVPYKLRVSSFAQCEVNRWVNGGKSGVKVSFALYLLDPFLYTTVTSNKTYSCIFLLRAERVNDTLRDRSSYREMAIRKTSHSEKELSH